MTKFSYQNLIASGYKVFSDNYKYASRMFQKRIVRDDKTQYFIQIYHYEDLYSKGKDGFMPDVQLYLREPKDVFLNIQFGGSIETIEETENLIQRIFEQLECLPDKHN